jgi:hypothetical protein
MVSGAEDLKPYKNKEWLKKQMQMGKSQRRIAGECGVSEYVISKYCKPIKNAKVKARKISQEWYKKNGKEHYVKNRKKYLEKAKIYAETIKIKAMSVIGRVECTICGESNIKFLTIDHINNDGNEDRRNGFASHGRLYSSIKNGSYPEDSLKNLRVLCYNHNFGRRREYLSCSWGDQTYQQRCRTKLYEKALDFFGPCPHCGISDLRYLSISHKKGDAVERVNNGEPRGGLMLLYYFNKQGWPQSLKEDFCLECFNYNCSRRKREE